MKHYVLSLVLVFFISTVIYSQNSTPNFNPGDVFLIGNVNANDYKYIDFPRPNFIVKKGGIVNYKRVKGEKVVITSIKEKGAGKHIATIKLVEPRKFFNSHTYVTVDIEKAIKSKELLVIED